MGRTMGAGNVADDDAESLVFADEFEYGDDHERGDRCTLTSDGWMCPPGARWSGPKRGYRQLMTNDKNDQDKTDQGDVTEAAKAMHGEQARVEQHDQPAESDVVALDGDTRIAKPADDGE